MTLYQPPTDSLYKLLALTGAAISVFFLHSWSQEAQELLDQGYALTAEISVAEAESTKTLEDMKTLDAEITRLESKKPEELKPEDRVRLQRMRRRYNGYSRQFSSIQTQLVGKQAAKEAWSSQLELHRVWRIVAGFGTFSGICASILGFSLWYRKLQRHQDRMLELKAQAIERIALAAPRPASELAAEPKADTATRS